MRFLGIGDWCDLGDMYLRLAAAGHEVRVHVGEAMATGSMTGMVERIEDWREHLAWVRESGPDGLIVFEDAKSGTLHDDLRRQGLKVIGGSALGARLEGDRAFGQRTMRDVGMRTAATHGFDDYAAAIAFIRDHPGRWVYKFDGDRFPSTHNYVGELVDGSDVIGLLDHYRASWRFVDQPRFVLMERLDGVEVGVGAYFDGSRFLEAVCLDWEHKRFFPGDLGELTGEMGTLVTYRGARRLFDDTLAHMAPLLAASGYCGYINLNTIVNDAGVWPLEFTCRFGYPGFAILDELHEDGWDVILARLAAGSGPEIRTRPGYAVGVVLTVPPFPRLRRSALGESGGEATEDGLALGTPISFRGERGELGDDERARLHYAEVARHPVSGRLVTSGVLGYLMVATGSGPDARSAQRQANALAGKVVVPNLRYRTDIGERFIARDQATLRRLGYLPTDDAR